MTKNIKYNKSIFQSDIKDLRSFIKKKIETSYDCFIERKTLLALIPLIGSVAYTFSSGRTDFKLTDYLRHNLKSLSNEKEKPRKLQTVVYKTFFNDLKKLKSFSLDAYQRSQLINIQLQVDEGAFIKGPGELPAFISSEKKNVRYNPQKMAKGLTSIEDNKILKEVDNLFQVRKLQHGNQIISANPYSLKITHDTLLHKLALSKINKLNATDVYFFMKRQGLFSKTITKKETRSMSGNMYFTSSFNRSYNTLNLGSLEQDQESKKNGTGSNPYFEESRFPLVQFSNSHKSNIFETKGRPFHQNKIVTSRVDKNENQMELTTPKKNREYSLFIDEISNDVVFENPNILAKLLYKLKYQNEFNTSGYDFFGGVVKRRQKFVYVRPGSEDENNIFIYDLKSNYNPVNKWANDLDIVKNKFSENHFKYSTNVREVQNRYGDKYPFPIISKSVFQMEMRPNRLEQFNRKNSLKTDSQLQVSIDTPTFWENENNINNSSLPKSCRMEPNLLSKNKNEAHHIPAYDKTSPKYTKTIRQGDVFASQQIQHFQFSPSIFSRSTDNSFIIDTYQYLNNAAWLSFSQLSISFFLMVLLAELYKTYQRELGFYLLEFTSRLNFYDEDIKNLIDQVYNDGNLRIFKNLNTSFTELGGMIELLPKFGETVWYLKNGCRPSTYSDLIPKAILLVGPPGTGKTLLVKAIGSEANVPVLIQSGNGIIEDSDGVTKLQEAFKKARALSPCILFIDEMDSIGAKRTELQLSSNQNKVDHNSDVLLRPDLIEVASQDSKSSFRNQDIGKKSPQKLSALTQLLVELDGIESRRGFVVFGATNRSETLDPALIRPGRFNDIIEIGLPNFQKRIEILKIYTSKLGIDETVNFLSLGQRTVGFSAADLATIVNRSAIRSIIDNQTHTEVSLVQGVKDTKDSDKIALMTEASKSKIPSNLMINLAYYELGRLLVKEKLLNLKKNNSSLLHFLLNEAEISLYGVTNDAQKPKQDLDSTEFTKLAKYAKLTNLFRSFENSDRDKLVELIKQKIETFSPPTKDLILWVMINLAGKATEFLYTSDCYNASNTLNMVSGSAIKEKKKTEEQESILDNKIQNVPKSVETFMDKSNSDTSDSKRNILRSVTSFNNVSDLRQITTIGDIDLYKANLIAEYYQKSISKINYSEVWAYSGGRNKENKNYVETTNSYNFIGQQLNDFPNKQLWNTESIWLNLAGAKMANLNWRKWFRVHLSNPEVNIFNEEIIFPDFYQIEQKQKDLDGKINNQFSVEDLLSNSMDFDIQNILLLALRQNIVLLDASRQELDQLVFNFLTSAKENR